MRIVFIGSSKFGLRCLKLAYKLTAVQVVGVVTAPETFVISYRPEGVTNILHADISSFARMNRVPYAEISNGMNDHKLFNTVQGWQPNIFLVAGWYHMIPKQWRDLAPTYGLHASLLPDYSGGAPLVWAMINGESKTGITLFQIDDGVDSGPIVAQAEEPIYDDDTIASLYARIEERGLALLREFLPALAQGALQLRPQKEDNRRIMPQRSPTDGRINWNSDAFSIDRFIRAQTKPYPGAFSIFNSKTITIWSAKPWSESCNIASGVVQRTFDGRYIVSCISGAIELKEVAYEQRTYTGYQLAELIGGGGSGWATCRAA